MHFLASMRERDCYDINIHSLEAARARVQLAYKACYTNLC